MWGKRRVRGGDLTTIDVSVTIPASSDFSFCSLLTSGSHGRSHPSSDDTEPMFTEAMATISGRVLGPISLQKNLQQKS